MDNDGHLFVISYPDLERSDFDKIQHWRKEFDPHGCTLIDPHITLVFSVTPDLTDQLTLHTSEIAASHSAIKFVIDRTLVRRVVGQNLWHLFLAPGSGSEMLTQLHRSLQSGEYARFFRTEMPFVPYITIGSFTDAESCVMAAHKLAEEPMHIEGSVSELTLIHDRGKRIDLMQTFRLVS